MNSAARGVNDHGVIVGYSAGADGSTRAVLWDEGRRIADLGVMPGDTSSLAEDVNNNGWVVGSTDGDAVVWKP